MHNRHRYLPFWINFLFFQISLLELKMATKWLVGAVVMGLVLIAVSASKDSDSTSDRTKRQYHSRRPASLVSRNPSHLLEAYSPEDESVVVYDPAGLGFEIQKPGSLHYQYRQSESLKSAPYSQPKPVYREPAYRPELPKPAYPEPAYRPEPPYRPAYSHPTKLGYKNEKPYPAAEPYPTSDYSDPYAYYCPKVAGYESHCRPAKDCAIWYDAVLATPGTACKLPDGNPGNCCPALPYNSNVL